MNTPHKHADAMAEYAKDAAETEEPWKRWRFKSTLKTSCWERMTGHPTWVGDLIYERIPKTININGHEVPEPLREAPELMTAYWYPAIAWDQYCAGTHWAEDPFDYRIISLGLMHLTEEAAVAHAKALLSFTSTQEQNEQ